MEGKSHISKDFCTMTAVVLFMAAAVFFFLPVPVPHKIVACLAILTLFSIRRNNILITAAFCFSFLGDFSGSFGGMTDSVLPFIGQMSSFAIAHILFIKYFLSISPRVRSINELEKAILALLICSASIIILPKVKPLGLAAGVGTYLMLISTMLYSAFTTKKLGIIIGACLFVISDYILAVNKFVIDVPYSRYLIMVPYYAAQLMFFLSTRNQIKES